MVLDFSVHVSKHVRRRTCLRQLHLMRRQSSVSVIKWMGWWEQVSSARFRNIYIQSRKNSFWQFVLWLVQLWLSEDRFEAGPSTACPRSDGESFQLWLWPRRGTGSLTCREWSGLSFYQRVSAKCEGGYSHSGENSQKQTGQGCLSRPETRNRSLKRQSLWV